MKTIIVGGGIFGLSVAWFLHKKDPTAQIVLLEKENRLGGCIRTVNERGFLFEQGPRTFPIGRSPWLLHIAHELGLEIILANGPSTKYIYTCGKLKSLSSFLPSFLPHFIREPFVPPADLSDESIYDFASRRFSPKIANVLFDAMTLGVYAGDMRKLSMRACFPTIYNWEKEKRSVLKGLFCSPKKNNRLFTLRHGMQSLIDAMAKALPLEIVLNCDVKSIESNCVKTENQTFYADKVISAIPQSYPTQSLWVVNLGFEKKVLKKKGFGYLVPSLENESLLGMIWDSSVFPEQGAHTRLTAMVRSHADPIATSINALSRHLSIEEQPSFTAVHFAKNAIPQFLTGCSEFEDVSVEGKIAKAYRLVFNTKKS